MATNDTVKKAKPGYVSWRTLYNFIGKLKETVIPPRIDKSVMKGMSGASQSQLRISLRWLGLIDDDDNTQDRLEELVAVHGTDTEWKNLLSGIVTESYSDLIAGVDIAKGTGTELAARFRESGLSGATLAKAVRFYLGAMKSAGLPYSPHFSAPSVERKQFKRKDSSGRSGQVKREEEQVTRGRIHIEPVEGMILQAFSIPGRKDPIQVLFPWDLKPAEWEMVSGFMLGFIELGA